MALVSQKAMDFWKVTYKEYDFLLLHILKESVSFFKHEKKVFSM